MPIKLPIVMSTPSIFPIGADINSMVSAIALTAYINMHIIITKNKKIIYSFLDV